MADGTSLVRAFEISGIKCELFERGGECNKSNSSCTVPEVPVILRKPLGEYLGDDVEDIKTRTIKSNTRLESEGSWKMDLASLRVWDHTWE
jgi:hypothetical protein